MEELIEQLAELDIDEAKQNIIEIFNKNVRYRKINLDDVSSTHDGKKGHWLEKQMGIKHNAKNEPDINGYEMKTGDKVITFIDKAPSYMYLNEKILDKRNKRLKEEFWNKYGSKKLDKPTIGGWSIKKFNKCGQIIKVDDHKNIIVKYNYEEDTRDDKDRFGLTKTEPHVIMKWEKKDLENAIERKFNQKGFFKCIEENGKFTKICFGKKINFKFWIDEFEKGNIYHDGYSRVDGRGRHVFRAKKMFWDTLLTEFH